MTHELDMALIEGLGRRAGELFAPHVLRAYSAALVSRINQRVPYGRRAMVDLPRGRPTKLAENTTDENAMFVTIDIGATSPVIYSTSNDAGSTNFTTPAQASGAPRPFVLFPGEALFGTATTALNTAMISQETF